MTGFSNSTRVVGEQAHRVEFMIRDRGSNFTAAFDAVEHYHLRRQTRAGGAINEYRLVA
ncbi:MAG TPA: hypothetical protein VGA04_05415 [Streptosporangiaceae bacterium]